MSEPPKNTSENANQPYIFLDLDGVMADFDSHAISQGKYAADGKVKWDELDYQWWVTMPACEGAKEFYDAAKNLGIVKFLTAPVPNTACFAGKADWLQAFIPERGKFALLDLIMCAGKDKNFLAKPTHILIDDRDKNVQSWIDNGGIGIHHKGDFRQTMKALQAAVEKISPPVIAIADKPKLIVIGGISGSGKTTLGAALAKILPNAVHLDADRTRKEIYGVAETTRLPQEAYSSEATQKFIDESNRRVKQFLSEGKTVIVSAAILSQRSRETQEQTARENNANFVGIMLKVDDLKTLFDRVANRANDPSDAGVDIVKSQASEAFNPGTWSVIDAGQSPDDVVREALKIIENNGAQRKSEQPPSAPRI